MTTQERLTRAAKAVAAKAGRAIVADDALGGVAFILNPRNRPRWTIPQGARFDITLGDVGNLIPDAWQGDDDDTGGERVAYAPWKAKVIALLREELGDALDEGDLEYFRHAEECFVGARVHPVLQGQQAAPASAESSNLNS